MNEKITFDSVDRFQRIEEHFPKIADPVLIILKGHLLAEEILDNLLRFYCKEPEALGNVEIGFFLKCKLVRALTGRMHSKGYIYPEKIWLILESLNSLRNELAHSLESEKVDSKTQRFLSVAIYPKNELSQENSTGARLLYSAMIGSLGFLSCFEYIVITGELPPEIENA